MVVVVLTTCCRTGVAERTSFCRWNTCAAGSGCHDTAPTPPPVCCRVSTVVVTAHSRLTPKNVSVACTRHLYGSVVRRAVRAGRARPTAVGVDGCRTCSERAANGHVSVLAGATTVTPNTCARQGTVRAF